MATDSQEAHYGPYGPYGPVFQIVPGVQSYDWGLLGKGGSFVAKYAQATDELEFKQDDEKPYAELWMGTHPSLPSSIVPPPPRKSNPASLISLSSYLSRHTALLGNAVYERYGADAGKGALPFLFKVLSIGKALSIQAHPDQKLAQKLHKEKPDMYKDDNHKPEMAIAITPFRGFCNFRPLEQIQAFLRDVPELRSLIDPDDALQAKLDDASKLASSKPEDVESNKEMLREIFSKLMKADPDTVAPKAESMVKRFESESELESECKSTSGSTNGVKVDADLAGLVCKIYSQFPGDVGVFCAFLLNVVDLEPGQAIFLRANEPHAYLQGNIMECMAASDNVVRAGLTPKARDVEVLVDMLTYNYGPSDRQLMRPRPFVPLPTSKSAPAYPKEAKEEQQLAKDAAAKSELPTLLYDPPIEEFSVLLTRLSKRSESNEEETQRPLQGPSILITTSGRGQLEYIPAQEPEQGQEREPTPAETPKENGHVAPSPSPSPSRKFELAKAGQVFFVGAGTTVTLRVAEDAAEDEELVVFRAFVEIDEK